METIIDELERYVAKSTDVKRPELSNFSPVRDDEKASLLSSLWLDSSDVPLDPREETRDGLGWTGTMFPSFLLNGLKNSTANIKANASSAYKSIDTESKKGAYFLYGTSGAGKTRSIFEYLSTNKGFYFLCNDFKRNAGSKDLKRALDYFHSYLGKTLPIRDDEVENTPVLEEQYRNKCTPISEENYRNLQHLVQVLVYIRHSIYCLLNARFENLTPYEWLLYQLYPEEFLGKDLFADATKGVVKAIINNNDDFLKVAAKSTLSSEMMDTEWSIFVDEAQVLLDRGKMCFMSSKTSTRRSFFCALAKAFCGLATAGKIRFPVFAGTGMSIVELQDEAISTSISGKKLGMNAHEEAQYFTNFALMDHEGVRAYLQCFLNLDNVSDAVLSHVCKWLRGRPRWSATFLEVYVMREKRNDMPDTPDRILLEALRCYLNVMTSDPNPEKTSKKRASWRPGPASAFASFERFIRSEQDTVKSNAVTELRRAMLKFAVGQRPNEFDKDVSQLLIRLGLVAIKATDDNIHYTQGHLDEPIIVEAGLNFMCIDDALRDNYKNQEDGGLGHAFERLILPALLKDRKKFSEVAESMVQGYNHVLPDKYYHGTRSSYGVLALDAQAHEDPTSKTLEWIKLSMEAKFEGQVPPFCFPVEAFGPDVIFLLYNEDYSDFRACLVQSKHRNDFSQPDALRTLVPEWLFFKNRANSRRGTTLADPHLNTWNNLKSDLVSDIKPCVRLVVQYPKSRTKSATPGFIAAGVAENEETTPKTAGKRDLLLTVDDKNFGLFGKKMEALAALRKPPNKKQKSSCPGDK